MTTPITEKNRPKKKYPTLRDKNAPKQPSNAYALFVKNNWKEYQMKSKDRFETSSMLSKKWAEMNETEKKPYLDEYALQREKYQEEFEQYKQSEQYTEFQKKKSQFMKEKQRAASKARRRGESPEQPRIGMKIFSDEFIAVNKTRERELREIRRQANDLYYENELIDNATDSLKEQLDNISNDVFTEEETSRFDTQTTERWRRAVLEAFRGSNLLEKLKLTPTSSTEDIILRIEANTKGNMEQAIRKCLNSIDFSGSSSV